MGGFYGHHGHAGAETPEGTAQRRGIAAVGREGDQIITHSDKRCHVAADLSSGAGALRIGPLARIFAPAVGPRNRCQGPALGQR